MERNPNLKILLVDDDHDFCHFIVDLIFRRVGIKPKVAKNGLEAEEIMKNWCPDVLITDTNMPHKNGVELIQAVRANYSQVVIFSLFNGLIDSPVTGDEIKAMGVYMVLNKSEIPSRLLPALEMFAIE